MDEAEWKVCLKSLKKVLERKKQIRDMTLKNVGRDIEELEFTISCYEKKIAEMKK
jgi:hypothetical protein